MSSFINLNNRDVNTEAKYSAEVIKVALLKSETKSSRKADEIVKNITEPISLNEALTFFTDKLVAIKSLSNSIIEVNEGRVKQFEMDYEDMETSIKKGIGWIDPEYVVDTWENSSDSIDFELVAGEIYNRLIKAGLLWHADENGEEKGKQVKSLKELGIKESVVNESATKQLADEESFELYDAELTGKSVTLTVTSTTKTWDDGVPVLKYLARGSAKPTSIQINGSFEVAHDVARGWFYFTDGRKWYALHQEDGYNDPSDLPFKMTVKESKEPRELTEDIELYENYEVIFSDGVSQMKKFRSEALALDFMKKTIASNKKLRDIAVYRPGMHSTTQTELVVSFWGEGSYLDNVSKKDPALAAKKLEESVVTEAKKPKFWDSIATMNAIKAWQDGEFDLKDKESIDKWETTQNGGIPPKPSFGTAEIIKYAIATGKKPNGEKLEESVNEARSINKIQKDWNQTTTDMQNKVAQWKEAEGDRKTELLDELKALTAKKKALESELEVAVAGKDKDLELAVSEASKPINEGQFSWMTHDTGEQIGSERENRITVYMFDNEGVSYKESKYDGYGEFGGKDYYELLAQMNGIADADRQDGIDLAFDEKKVKAGKVLFPALVTDPRFNWKKHDFTQEAEHDPNQSWYVEPEYDDDYDEYDESKVIEGNAFLAARAKAIEEGAEEFEFNGKKYPVVKEGNAFGAARAEAIAKDEEEFEVDGEKFPVKSVDKEDEENAKEFVEEKTEITLDSLVEKFAMTNEDLRSDIKKYIKDNKAELDTMADADQWDEMFQKMYNDFGVEPDSSRGRDLLKTFQFIF